MVPLDVSGWTSMTSNVSGPNNTDVQPYPMLLQTAIDLTANGGQDFQKKKKKRF